MTQYNKIAAIRTSIPSYKHFSPCHQHHHSSNHHSLCSLSSLPPHQHHRFFSSSSSTRPPSLPSDVLWSNDFKAENYKRGSGWKRSTQSTISNVGVDYLRSILTASVYDVAIESPLHRARNLSLRVDNNVWLKREDQQPVFSFKLRGAYNKMAKLTDDEKSNGVITASAGNHAQGVALAASRMGVKATIVMPVHTPAIKVDAVRRLGGDVILHGDDFDAARLHCIHLSKEQHKVIVHPYDDPHVIAGQGTVAMEILRQYPTSSVSSSMPPIDAIFVSVGGGGLIAGIAAYVKSICPEIKIIGVETDDANAMTLSMHAGKRVMLSDVGLFADGAAVKLVGEETFKVCQPLIDEIVEVTNDEVCAAIKDAFEDTRAILEPAGALSVAGVKRYIDKYALKNKSFVCVTSGANMNFNKLKFVAERCDVGEKREALLAVTIPEEPGSFMRLYSILYPRNVTEFSYRYSDQSAAHVYVSFEVREKNEAMHVIDKLQTVGMKAIDITDNEMAKNHTRYMGGGRSSVRHERVYRFKFPERPGALLRFLQTLQSAGPSGSHSHTAMPWNVTLFHYRNYGADIGNVLAGIEVPDHLIDNFNSFLDSLNYPYVNENDNPVYKQFLL